MTKDEWITSGLLSAIEQALNAAKKEIDEAGEPCPVAHLICAFLLYGTTVGQYPDLDAKLLVAIKPTIEEARRRSS